jgi:hypothetical protein
MKGWGWGVLLALAACPAHREVIPLIRVDPRAAGRADWLGHAAEPKGAEPAPARVHVMKDGEQLGGPNAAGRPGDLVLENAEVVFVIEQLGAGSGFAESGGDVVDAADAHVRKDELGQVFTYFGTFPRQAVYDRLASGASPDGSAWVEARGRELFEAKLAVTTRYTLHAPDRALLLETTLDNGGDVAIELAALGDAVQWGGVEKLAPGRPVGFKGPSSGPYVGGVGRFTSYAFASTEGDLDATSGRSWTDTTQRKGVKLAPGQSASYARVLVVGERPDTSSLVGELAMAAGAAVGTLEAAPSSPGPLPTGFKLALRAEGATEALTLAPPFVAQLPAGRYHLVDGAGQPAGGAGPFDVVGGHPVRVEPRVDPPASLEVRCVGPDAAEMPCKVTFEGVGSTPTPWLGFPHASGPARNQATTATGSVEVDVAAGRYRVTASRGPEYALATADVELAPREHALRTLALERVVDTRGYVAADFHQHTTLGMDAPVTARDRIIANAAEGVEVAVASEHNLIADLEPVVRELHLDAALVSLPGDELTSDSNRSPWGHANAFPLPVDPGKPRGGAPVVRNRTASDVFDEVRRTYGDVVLQINHPRSGHSGYFDLLAFDPASGAGTGAGYDARFDALEVWNGRNADARAQVLGDFFALLRAGRAVTPTADTDTHGVVGQEAGYPRTYVRVADDGHFDAWDAARAADFVRGIKVLRDVVLTNGPMLRVTANGAPIGGVARGRKVHVRVEVESAPWVVVDEVAIVRASAAGGEAPARKPVVGKLVAGALRASAAFELSAASDDAFVVVASGTRPMSPVLAGEGDDVLPWAMTGAVWIDADGDGSSMSERGPSRRQIPR